MVANSINTAERFVPLPDPFIAGRWRVPRLTRADATLMVRAGIIAEDASTELLDGLIVLTDRSARNQDPTMMGQAHRRCVERLSALRKLIDAVDRHVETQQPLVCTETHVPQPDFMVLRGTLEAYDDLPHASDSFCVVEVADSSYERDSVEKLQGYARAGVAQYVIINLRNRCAEMYALPDRENGTYPAPAIISESEALSIRIGNSQSFDIALAELLR